MEFKGIPGPYFANFNLTFDQSQRMLIGLRWIGQELFGKLH